MIELHLDGSEDSLRFSSRLPLTAPGGSPRPHRGAGAPLVFVSEEPGRTLRMKDLAVLTNASLSRLSHLVTRLERWGFVRREPDPANGRYTNAILTDAGYAKLVGSAPAHVAAARQLVIDEFTATELAELREFCERISARIEASPWKLELT